MKRNPPSGAASGGAPEWLHSGSSRDPPTRFPVAGIFWYHPPAMEFFGGLLLPMTIVFAATGVLVWTRNPGRLRHGLAFMFGLSVSAWSLALYLVWIARTGPEAVLWTRVAFMGPIAAVITYLALLRDFEEGGIRSLVHWTTVIGPGFGVILAIFAFHPEVVQRALPGGTGVTFEYGRYYNLEMAGCGLLAFLGFARGWQVCLRLSGRERAQAEIVLVGMVLSGALSALPNVILPILGLSGAYFMGPFGFSVGVSCFYYAMAKHRLYDIELALGPLFKGKRFWLHERVKEVLSNPQNYLDLSRFSRSLQSAFEVPDLSIALLTEHGRSARIFGRRDFTPPSAALLTYPSGKILTPEAVPKSHRLEMEQKGYTALVRIGEAAKPTGMLVLGNSFDKVLYSTQDLSLLGGVASQLEIAVRVAGEFRSLAGRSPAEEEETTAGTAILPWATAGRRMKLVCFDPESRVRKSLGTRIGADFVAKYVEAEAEFLGLASDDDFDLGVISSAGGEEVVTSLLHGLEDEKRDLAVMVLLGHQTPARGEISKWIGDARVLGACEMDIEPDNAIKLLRVAAAGARYFRGEVDPDILNRIPTLAVKLFPILIRSVAQGRDFSGMTRLFQRRLLELVISGSKTQVEAARKLGLSPANLSLKLISLGMRQKGSSVEIETKSRQRTV